MNHLPIRFWIAEYDVCSYEEHGEIIGYFHTEAEATAAALEWMKERTAIYGKPFTAWKGEWTTQSDEKMRDFNTVSVSVREHVIHPTNTSTAEGEPELHLLMVLSTSHIAEFANELLTDVTTKGATQEWSDAGPATFVDKVPYGFLFVLNNTEGEDMERWHLGGSVRDVVNYARERGATHLRLDRDGPVVAGLPTYNW